MLASCMSCLARLNARTASGRADRDTGRSTIDVAACEDALGTASLGLTLALSLSLSLSLCGTFRATTTLRVTAAPTATSPAARERFRPRGGSERRTSVRASIARTISFIEANLSDGSFESARSTRSEMTRGTAAWPASVRTGSGETISATSRTKSVESLHGRLPLRSSYAVTPQEN